MVLNREFLSDNVIRPLRDAHVRALDHGRATVTPMDLLISLLTTPKSIVAECFERIGVTAAKLTEMAVIAEQQAGGYPTCPARLFLQAIREFRDSTAVLGVLRAADQDGFERLMNWVVGTLLFGAVAVLVFVQSHPPV